jgi:virulence-associated protein VapD
MAYPPKIDPMNATWVIAIDFKLDKLKSYCEENLATDENDINCKQLLNNYRTQIFNTFYDIVGQYDFKYRMQNSLVFNNSTDATKAFKAVSLGIKKSWVKYFVEKIHLFEVDPNSDAVDLLELDEATKNNPEWITDSLIEYLKNDKDTKDEW